MDMKLRQKEQLKAEYTHIIEEQLEEGIVERIPSKPTGKRVFYLPHKAVVRTEAVTTKVRMVFDASAKPHPLAASINECMYTGPSLQPLLWDIMIRSRMSENLLLGDIKKAFLQIGIKEEDRDAFRFLFTLHGKEEHLRFARVPFGAEASPFILGATLRYHIDQQPDDFAETVQELKTNTYVELSYLMYDAHSKTAPKILLDKFAKINIKHHCNTRLSARECFSVKFYRTEKMKKIFY